MKQPCRVGWPKRLISRKSGDGATHPPNDTDLSRMESLKVWATNMTKTTDDAANTKRNKHMLWWVDACLTHLGLDLYHWRRTFPKHGPSSFDDMCSVPSPKSHSMKHWLVKNLDPSSWIARISSNIGSETTPEKLSFTIMYPLDQWVFSISLIGKISICLQKHTVMAIY